MTPRPPRQQLQTPDQFRQTLEASVSPVHQRLPEVAAQTPVGRIWSRRDDSMPSCVSRHAQRARPDSSNRVIEPDSDPHTITESRRRLKRRVRRHTVKATLRLCCYPLKSISGNGRLSFAATVAAFDMNLEE